MVGNKLVPERFLNLSVPQKKCSRHALHVTRGRPNKMPLQPRKKHPIDALTIEILTKLGANQPKRLIELRIRIGKTRNISKFVGGEKSFGLFFRTQVDKRQLRPAAFDLRAFFRELGDRLAAKGSTEVPQKRQKQWRLIGVRSKCPALLRAEGTE
jgi:hypothetical protein